jgi:iron complex outermembrane receptor protein
MRSVWRKGPLVAAVVAAVWGVLLQPRHGSAQPAPGSGQTVTGRVWSSLTAEAVAGAQVTLEELGRRTRTGEDGGFVFDGVPPGRYHLGVRADGFLAKRIEIEVPGAGAPVGVSLDPELHFSEVVSVSPEPRDPLAAYQPTSVLAGQELAIRVESSLGAALEAAPGVAERSFGPASSRPVIRGFDGDRVLILEDGQRVGDLSSQSADHGVAVNPAAASRIEVVRGPATLLYGASAIGGLVNVIAETIPSEPVTGVHGTVTLDGGTASSEAGAAGDVRWGDGRWAFRAGGSARRSGDLGTPVGSVDNTSSRSGLGDVALAWTGERVFVGGSYGYDDTRYGVPVIEGGNVTLTPRRHTFSLRAGGRGLDGAVEAFRATFGHRRYRHNELEGDEVGTRFRNDTTELELLVTHRPAGRLKGTIGAWLLDRAFEAVGEEALAPPVDQRNAAVFVYEELGWPHVTLQFGARLEHARYDPSEGLPARRFTDLSASTGVLFRPAAAGDNLTIAVSLARAARHPALEELYFHGEHPGNFAFEIGNPALDSERALGLDVSLRWRHPRANGEISYFRNTIDDYIFRNPTGEIEDGFAVVEFVASDSLLQGIEAHADVPIGRAFVAELGVDYVRGELRDTGRPLPRIPPFRVRTGLRYQAGALQAGGEIVAVADQRRVFGAETPTAGYALVKLFGAYSFGRDGVVQTVTVRLDNATNRLYRNHLSLIKDLVPEQGRSLRVLYSMTF